MKTRELGMELSYASNWTPVDAIREFFQNAIDEAQVNPENTWFYSYSEEDETLRVGNKLGQLETRSLLLGSSTKRDDVKTIGKHGEGYKVGTNVLLRNSINVTVFNYNKKEIWHSRVVNSRTYNTPIGVFDIEKMGILKSVPENNLVFEISPVSSELWEEVIESNLWLQSEKEIGETIQGEMGRVLLNPKYKGKLYVKGLYVCSKPQMQFGWDLTPELINLDRDRGLVDSFDLQYSLGKVIIQLKNVDFLNRVRKVWDGYYTRCFASSSDADFASVYEQAYMDFKKKYGEYAVPCSTNGDFNRLKASGYNAVMVSENDHYYISRSSTYSSGTNSAVKVKPLIDSVDEWYSEVEKYIPKELRSKWNSIRSELGSELG